MIPHRTPQGRLPPATALLAALVLTGCNAADPGEAPDATAPTGTTQASLDGTAYGGGPLTVANGDEFYLRVIASDDAGVTTVAAALRPAGTEGAYQPLGAEAVLGFTAAGPTCEPGLTTASTEPTSCVFAVTASDAALQDYELRGEAWDGRNAAGLEPVEVTVAARGTWYRDVDGDGYGASRDPEVAFEPPEGYVAQPGDCDDDAATTHPGAIEVPGDTVDNDCDGMTDERAFYSDADADTYGSSDGAIEAESEPAGYVANDLDCDDSRDDVHPGAIEVPGDTVDNDCDGKIDEVY